ncbi:hypothetical protein Tco_1126198 [Tanacetum coccineum]
MNVGPIPTTRIDKDHPKDQIIGDLNSAIQTRRMAKISDEHAMVRMQSYVSIPSLRMCTYGLCLLLWSIGIGRKFHLLEDKQIPSVGVCSTWMAFGGNTLAGDGVAGIKRRSRDLYGDGVRNFTMASGRGQLKEDLESSTWRRRQDF